MTLFKYDRFKIAALLTGVIVGFLGMEALWGANSAMKRLWKIRLILFLIPLLCSAALVLTFIQYADNHSIDRLDIEIERAKTIHNRIDSDIDKLGSRLDDTRLRLDKLTSIVESHESRLQKWEDRSSALLWLTGIVCVAVVGHLFGYLFQLTLKRELARLNESPEEE